MKVEAQDMQLYRILEGVTAKYNKANDGMEISGITHDSRKVKPGNIYVSLLGVKENGEKYIEEAVSNGARIVVSQIIEGPNVIKVENSRSAYSLMCKNFYEKASDSLKLIGVTGTNGKTTIVNLLAEILRSAGKSAAIVGTMGINYNGNVIDTGFTTPDPEILHKHFLEMKNSGVEYVVMEASAHALALKKLEGLNFELGLLTNITQDHLDFFGNMENYAKTKLSFFDGKHMKLGIICSDDDYGRKLINNPSMSLISYGLDNPSDVFAVNTTSDFRHSKFVCNCLDEIFEVQTNLAGKYNIENTLASIAAARAIGIKKQDITRALRYINPVEGRFNVIRHHKCNIVIDYAHTPDGLKKVLEEAKALTRGKLIAIFGCGGNRDRKKRPIMGKVASGLADKIILTSDNPRDEDPLDIISEIAKGVANSVPCEICENRAKAIAHGIEHASPNDTIVIAGKGGEKYQEIKGEKKPYNDFDAVYDYFRSNIKLQEGEDESNS